MLTNSVGIEMSADNDAMQMIQKMETVATVMICAQRGSVARATARHELRQIASDVISRLREGDAEDRVKHRLEVVK